MATKTKDVDLSSIWLFTACTQRELRMLRRAAEEVDVSAGRVLCKEGDPGREFFLILSGTAVVKRRGRTVATLGAGGYFGELALLDRLPRSATVIAKTDMSLLVLGQRELLGVLDAAPSIDRKLLTAMAGRLRAADARAFN